MKQKIESHLQHALHAYITEIHVTIPQQPIQIERPRGLNHGDFSSNIAMTLAKSLKLSPRELATHIIARLPKDDNIAEITIAGPGFINFTLSLRALTSTLQAMWISDT